MRNYVQKGELLDYANSSGGDIAAGSVVVLKSGASGYVGVAEDTIVNGTTGAVRVREVVSLPTNTSDTGAIGDQWYWDATNLIVTSTATNNTYAGRLAAPKAASDTTANVLLNQH